MNLTKFFIFSLICHLNCYFCIKAKNTSNNNKIAILYDESLSDLTHNLINNAIKNINKDAKTKWILLRYNISRCNTDAIIRSICGSIKDGSVVWFGSASLTSMKIISEFARNYRIPFFTWSQLNESGLEKKKIKRTKKDNKYQKIIFFESSQSDAYEEEQENIRLTFLSRDNKVYNSEVIFNLKPDLSSALYKLVDYYKWSRIYYIYNHEKAKFNINFLLQYQSMRLDIILRRVININKIESMLKSMISLPEKSIKIIVDLDTSENLNSFLNKIIELEMTNSRYHFILCHIGINELVLDNFSYKHAVLNGFSIVDYNSADIVKSIAEINQSSEPLNKINTIPSEAAMIIDGLQYFTQTYECLAGFIEPNTYTPIIDKCPFDSFNKNSSVNNHIVIAELKERKKCNNFKGLTGYFGFDKNGNRKTYKLEIYETTWRRPLFKTGSFFNGSQLEIVESLKNKFDLENKHTTIVSTKVSTTANKINQHINRKLIVVSIKDEPFFMIRDEPGKKFTGNERFKGYCVDLVEKISQILNFTYELRLVKDNKYGGREFDKNNQKAVFKYFRLNLIRNLLSLDSNGEWNGMVGELVRNEADLVVAPLTISSQREMVIEFTIPFMYIGVSIMIKKPKKEKPGIFSFMSPINKDLWFYVVFAYITTTFVLFLVCRISPYNWQANSSMKNSRLKNNFTLKNTSWFTLAAMLQQGVDYTPRSLSGRVLASVWWFFTLILISTYTANLAAFLTVESIVSPIENAEDLLKQSEIQYGSVEGGSTQAFFQNSKVPTYQEMWNRMKIWGPQVSVKNNSEGVQKVRKSKGKYAFLLESSVIEYLNEQRPCDTMKVGGDLDSKGYGIATPLNSNLSRPLHLAVLQLMEEGFLNELKSRWWYDRSECGHSSSNRKDSKRSLNLVNVSGTFYILIVGLLLSLLITILEIVYKTKKDSSDQKEADIYFKKFKANFRLSITGVYTDS